MRRSLWLACVVALGAAPRAAHAEDPCQGGEAIPPPPPPAPAGPPAMDEAYPQPEAEADAPPDALDAPAPMRAVAPARARRDILVESHSDRSVRNKATLAAVVATGVIAGLTGVYFNLDAHDASKAVSADRPTGLAWTAERAELVERADRSSTRAAIAYAVGGTLVVGAVIGWIVTAPKIQRTIIRTGMIAPAPGGAVVGGTWRF